MVFVTHLLYLRVFHLPSVQKCHRVLVNKLLFSVALDTICNSRSNLLPCLLLFVFFGRELDAAPRCLVRPESLLIDKEVLKLSCSIPQPGQTVVNVLKKFNRKLNLDGPAIHQGLLVHQSFMTNSQYISFTHL